jgi:4-coumarate--CoA ligase
MDTDQIAILPYSSGTTGLPKGVMLTHKNLVSNLVQGMHTSTNRFSSPDSRKLRRQFLDSVSNVSPLVADKHSLVFTIPPFFHIYGLNAILTYNMCSGNGTLTFPRFTPEAFLECIIKYRPSVLTLVPSLLLFLINHPSVTRDHLSSIKHINVGAAPVSIEVLEKYKMKAQRSVFIMQGYGMTETSPAIILAPLCTPPSKGGSTGHIYPNSEARVVSLTDGTNLGPNQMGELYLRGPQIMKGYLNNPEATKEILDDDGWLRTGDLVYYDDDQYFYIVDRTKELIKVKGNQVSPSELENVILELTDIADVAVSGIPDEMAGELPKAFIVLKENAKLTETDIVDYVKAKVAKYKQLKGGVTFLKAIPRNPSGKILRKDLKAMG